MSHSSVPIEIEQVVMKRGYQCTQCEFSHTNEERVTAHFGASHACTDEIYIRDITDTLFDDVRIGRFDSEMSFDP